MNWIIYIPGGVPDAVVGARRSARRRAPCGEVEHDGRSATDNGWRRLFHSRMWPLSCAVGAVSDDVGDHPRREPSDGSSSNNSRGWLIRPGDRQHLALTTTASPRAVRAAAVVGTVPPSVRCRPRRAPFDRTAAEAQVLLEVSSAITPALPAVRIPSRTTSSVPAGDLPVLETNCAAAHDQSGQCAQQCRLAGAVRAEHRGDRSSRRACQRSQGPAPPYARSAR